MDPLMFLAVTSLKATVILAVVFVIAYALRNGSSSVRYLIWAWALAAVLIAPALSLLIRWEIPLSGPAVAASAAPHGSAPQTITQSLEPATGERHRPASWILPLWLCGVGLAMMRLAVGHVRAFMSLRRAARVWNAEWQATLVEVESRTRWGKRPDLRQSRETDVPFSYGWMRPVILLPADSADWSSERRRVVLMHELVHLRRQDWLLFTLAQLACIVYWFHPLAWMALSRFRQEQERSCDDAVIRTGTAQSAYAEHLVSIARSVTEPRAAVFMASTHDLERRVEALLDPVRNRRGLTRGACAAAFAVAIACVAPLAALRAQDPRAVSSLSGTIYDASGATCRMPQCC